MFICNLHRYFFIIFSLCLLGCHSIGPKVLNRDRYDYNQSLSYSNNQELLLNLVRLRYDETPMVVKIGNISGSASLQSTLPTLGSATFDRYTSGTVNLGHSLQHTDNPIITYLPLDNQHYTEAFLKYLTLSDISLLLQSSWSINRVFRLSFQSVGNTLNAPSAARATTSHAPVYKEFLSMVSVLRRLQIADALRSSYVKKEDVEELTLTISPHYHLTAREKNILRKSGIHLNENTIILSNKAGPNKTLVITRSMFGILNYLSKGTMVPPVDLANKVANQTYYANGKVFDWQEVVKGMIKIYSSEKAPQDAIVAVPYRHRWYYIKDSDTDSKQTLILLANIAGLTQTPASGSANPPGLVRSVS